MFINYKTFYPIIVAGSKRGSKVTALEQQSPQQRDVGVDGWINGPVKIVLFSFKNMTRLD